MTCRPLAVSLTWQLSLPKELKQKSSNINPPPAENTCRHLNTHTHTPHRTTLLGHLQSKNRVRLRKRGEREKVAQVEINWKEGALFRFKIANLDTSFLVPACCFMSRTKTHSHTTMINSFQLSLSTTHKDSLCSEIYCFTDSLFLCLLDTPSECKDCSNLCVHFL